MKRIPEFIAQTIQFKHLDRPIYASGGSKVHRAHPVDDRGTFCGARTYGLRSNASMILTGGGASTIQLCKRCFSNEAIEEARFFQLREAMTQPVEIVGDWGQVVARLPDNSRLVTASEVDHVARFLRIVDEHEPGYNIPDDFVANRSNNHRSNEPLFLAIGWALCPRGTHSALLTKLAKVRAAAISALERADQIQNEIDAHVGERRSDE